MSQSEDKEVAGLAGDLDKYNTSGADGQQLQVAESEGKDTEVSDSPLQQAEKKGENEKDIYRQVLEKLDIKSENKDIQEQSMQDSSSNKESYLEQEKIRNLERTQHETQVKNIIAEDFAKIQNLMQLGLVDALQGQNLKQQVLKKAFDKLVQNEKAKQNLPPALQQKTILNKDEVFNEFNKENPTFFSSDGRKEVLDYLKSDDVIVGKDELTKISKMVENLENTAIYRYLKKVAYEECLINANEVAKQKLTANAQNSSFKDKNLSRTFTREQIGKMSSAEFAKYEPAIMGQLKKGLIK